VVHLRPRISDDLDIFGEEVVTVLREVESVGACMSDQWKGAYEAEECRELQDMVVSRSFNKMDG
jgi:hypothetical protein